MKGLGVQDLNDCAHFERAREGGVHFPEGLLDYPRFKIPGPRYILVNFCIKESLGSLNW